MLCQRLFASAVAVAVCGSAAFAAGDAAAVIDGHEIPMSDVIASCLRQVGPRVTELMVQKYVVDRECQRRGIVVSQAEIDARIEELKRSIAPATLEDGLKAHHQTREMLEDDIRQSIERVRLVEDQVKPTKMVHCRVIYVKFNPAGVPEAISGTSRTEAAARMTLAGLRQRIGRGETFGALAAQHSDIARDKNGDVGVLYPGIPGVDAAVLQAALAMPKGGITPEPVKGEGGYCLIQAISTSDDHSPAEAAVYADAARAYREQQAQFLVGKGIADLLARSKVEYFLHD